MWKTAKKGLLFNIACSRCCTRHNLCFHVESSQHADQKQLTRRDVFDLDTESTHCQPDSCPARPVNVDDGPEDIRWIQGLGGEKLPPASYAFLLKPDFSFFFLHRRGVDNFVACFLLCSAHTWFYQTHGRRPPRITGRFENNVSVCRSP